VAETERERREELLTFLWLLSLRLQREADREIRPELMAVMMGLHRLISSLPEDGIFRVYEWERLKSQIPDIVLPLENKLREVLPKVMQEANTPAQKAAARFTRQDEIPAIPERDDEQLLNTTVVAGTLLALELGRQGERGRFSRKVTEDLDRLVRYRLNRGEKTKDIAEHTMATTIKGGKRVATLRKGSWANGIWNRAKNMVQSGVWQQANWNVKEVWRISGATKWQWRADLERRNCPICAALNRQYRDTYDGFGYHPGFHPNCGCVIVPTKYRQ